MIEFVFTVDYEIYGNGEGSLRDLVYLPSAELRSVFLRHNARFVVFAEAAQLEMIEAFRSDPDIGLVKEQLREFHATGFEIGLHIHSWWYGARRESGRWFLDYDSYNLCTLSEERIGEILERSISYLRTLLGEPGFIPVSFRAGHLLFQPSSPLSRKLAHQGIKIDSSLYRGGLWRQHGLDYRRCPKNEPYWRFTDDITRPEPDGALLEVPIYTHMAPIWELFTSKRVRLQQVGLSAKQSRKKVLKRFPDMVRPTYPHKFDVGQMTKHEIDKMIENTLKRDEKDPSRFQPVVVIMHTKDPIDFFGMESLLTRLESANAKVSTFSAVLDRIQKLSQGESAN
jgi:hypothetical protein